MLGSVCLVVAGSSGVRACPGMKRWQHWSRQWYGLKWSGFLQEAAIFFADGRSEVPYDRTEESAMVPWLKQVYGITGAIHNRRYYLYMPITIKIKSMLASFLRVIGVSAWKLARYPNEHCAILMYHRVLPKIEQRRWVQAGMVVEPETLDLHIRYLRKNFQIVPLSTLATLHERPPRALREKPLCILTFDDGWYDFYKYAYPILKMNEAPATVFLPTDFIGTGKWFWSDRVGRLLDRMPCSLSTVKDNSGYHDPFVRQVVKMKGTFESRLERVMALLKQYRVEQIEEMLSKLAALVGENAQAVDRAFVSWEEVREMSGSGLISFGSHTAGHPIMTTLTENEARHELRKASSRSSD